MNQSRDEKLFVRQNFNSSEGFFGGVPLDHEAPIPVCDCISYLRQRSFFEIGVFRIPGNNDIVEKLKTNFNNHYSTKPEKEGSTYSVLNSSNPTPGVNDVASLLKSFFKELPTPLIPAVATESFVQVAGENLDKATEAKKFSKIVKAIKSPERECLGLIISFLRELCAFRKFNNMNADNLSTCFVLSIMGGGDAFNQLFLLREGASIIKKLIALPVKMYMPSVSNVKNNTKYRHVAEPEGAMEAPPAAAPERPIPDAPQFGDMDMGPSSMTITSDGKKKRKKNKKPNRYDGFTSPVHAEPPLPMPQRPIPSMSSYGTGPSLSSPAVDSPYSAPPQLPRMGNGTNPYQSRSTYKSQAQQLWDDPPPTSSRSNRM